MALRYTFKLLKYLYYIFAISIAKVVTWFKFKLNGVAHKDFKARGVPIVQVSLSGQFTIGKGFVIHSGKQYNMIGRQQQCFFVVGPNAILNIGSNVGLSGVAIICHKSIIIEDNVKVGGNTVIYDTDFHSLDASKRNANPENLSSVETKNVVIKQGVFIGAHSTILKGVVIGENSIIGASSVVSKSIPPNEIWAGNPAKFIKSIN